MMENVSPGGWNHEPYRPTVGTEPKVASGVKHWYQYLHVRWAGGSAKHLRKREEGWATRLTEWVAGARAWEPTFLYRRVKPTSPHSGIGAV